MTSAIRAKAIRHCGAALVLMGAALPVAAQSVVLYAGSRAEVVLPNGGRTTVALGRPQATAVPGLAVTPQSANQPVQSVCCARGVACATDRGAGLGAARAEVIGRYGAAWLPGSGGARLAYPGIAFSLDGNGRVQEICVVPR